jgi:hypothetical protein
MVTIHSLEVRIEVEAGAEESQFARLFQRYIRQWSRYRDEQAIRERFATDERDLSGPQRGYGEDCK